MSRSSAPAWQAFVVASVLLAITAGFGLGGYLMVMTAGHTAMGAWWEAAAQAHGHVQVFGWAGLMVLGVGLHVLPRLRGAPLARASWAGVVCALLVAGLALRALAQPLLALAHPGTGRALLGASLLCSGLLEVAAVTLLLWMLGATARRGPPLSARPGLRPVLPFFAVAFAALWLALAMNLLGLADAAQAGHGLVPDTLNDLTTWIGFYAFLVPVSVAMSARTFPIFLRTPLPHLMALRSGLILLVGGLVARLCGNVLGSAVAAGAGSLALAAALAAFVVALGVFGRRRPLPRETGARMLADPVRLHMLSAYAWLVVVIALLAVTALHDLGLSALSVDPDAERHALGAGFVTLLILGVGAFLLPGMTGRRLRGRGLLWVTLVLANGAAVLRVVPVACPDWLPAAAIPLSLSLAGFADLIALALFAYNVVVGRPPAARPARRGA